MRERYLFISAFPDSIRHTRDRAGKEAVVCHRVGLRASAFLSVSLGALGGLKFPVSMPSYKIFLGLFKANIFIHLRNVQLQTRIAHHGRSRL